MFYNSVRKLWCPMDEFEPKVSQREHVPSPRLLVWIGTNTGVGSRLTDPLGLLMWWAGKEWPCIFMATMSPFDIWGGGAGVRRSNHSVWRHSSCARMGFWVLQWNHILKCIVNDWTRGAVGTSSKHSAIRFRLSCFLHQNNFQQILASALQQTAIFLGLDDCGPCTTNQITLT